MCFLSAFGATPISLKATLNMGVAGYFYTLTG